MKLNITFYRKSTSTRNFRRRLWWRFANYTTFSGNTAQFLISNATRENGTFFIREISKNTFYSSFNKSTTYIQNICLNLRMGFLLFWFPTYPMDRGIFRIMFLQNVFLLEVTQFFNSYILCAVERACVFSLLINAPADF